MRKKKVKKRKKKKKKERKMAEEFCKRFFFCNVVLFWVFLSRYLGHVAPPAAIRGRQMTSSFPVSDDSRISFHPFFWVSLVRTTSKNPSNRRPTTTTTTTTGWKKMVIRVRFVGLTRKLTPRRAVNVRERLRLVRRRSSRSCRPFPGG